MGKRRQNRRLNAVRTNSEISVNDGDISSGSESENAVVQEKSSRTAVTDKTAHISTVDPVSLANIGSTSINLRLEEGLIGNARTDTHMQKQPNQELIHLNLHEVEHENGARASGDDAEVRNNTEITKITTTLQTFIDQVNQQSIQNKRTLKECIGSVSGMIRENNASTSLIAENGRSMTQCMKGTSEMMKECVRGMAEMVKDTNTQ